MTKSQIDFDKEETEIIEAFLFLYSAKDKKEAIKQLVRRYRNLDEKINEAIKVKKKGVK